MPSKIFIFCPKMPILATWNPLVRECQELPSTGKIVMGNGVEHAFKITFPKVKVRWQRYGEWLVDKVPAKGHMDAGGSNISVTMEKEKVIRTSWTTMDAQPVAARGHVIMPDGSKGIIEMLFPKCTATASGLGIFKYIAEPVTAEGTVIYVR